jgi:hypothetical protein
VYALEDGHGSLRIAENVREFAAGVLQSLERLPPGVTADGVSVRPNSMNFGPELSIHLQVHEV